MKTDFDISKLNSTATKLDGSNITSSIFTNVMDIYVIPHDNWKEAA